MVKVCPGPSGSPRGIAASGVIPGARSIMMREAAGVIITGSSATGSTFWDTPTTRMSLSGWSLTGVVPHCGRTWSQMPTISSSETGSRGRRESFTVSMTNGGLRTTGAGASVMRTGVTREHVSRSVITQSGSSVPGRMSMITLRL